MTASPDLGTTNQVPVPSGLSLQQFTELVGAKQGVATFLDPHADASVLTALETATDAWLGSLGPYFLYELVAQAPAGSVLAARLATYTADHPVTETVTPEQDAAATQAVSNGIAAEAPPTPEVPAEPAPVVPDLPFNVDAHHALDSLPVGSTATKTDANTVVTLHGTTGIESQTTIGTDDATAHLPVGATVDKTADGTAITLPANEHRGLLVVLGADFHNALAAAWGAIVNVEHDIAAALKKL